MFDEVSRPPRRFRFGRAWHTHNTTQTRLHFLRDPSARRAWESFQNSLPNPKAAPRKLTARSEVSPFDTAFSMSKNPMTHNIMSKQNTNLYKRGKPASTAPYMHASLT